MPTRQLQARHTWIVVIASLAFVGGCISTESDLLDSSEGCDEIAQGTVASLEIDPAAVTFVEASADVTTGLDEISESVLEACAGIARDLGAEDSWSGFDDLDDRISNDADTGACDVALSEIDSEMTEASEVGVDVVLAVAEGECHVDFEAQRDCDAECAASTTCESGSFESRCEPGAVSALCSGTCSIGSWCVGTADVPANCMGMCQSTCVGECKGECFHEDGSVTHDDPNCMGKCASSCNGECYGQCKVEAAVSCGAGIRCRGTCEGTIESPSCTTEYEPPQCEVDIPCYESCAARIAAEAACTANSVNVLADIDASPNLDPLVATLETHLPPLFEAAQNEGRLMHSAGVSMTEAGSELNDRVEDLDGKSLACVGVASTALADSVDALAIAVEASLDIEASFEVDAQTHP